MKSIRTIVLLVKKGYNIICIIIYKRTNQSTQERYFNMYDLITVIYLMGLIVSAICVIVVFCQKPSKEQNIAALMMVFCMVIWLGYWLGIRATSIEQLIISKKLNYIGAIGEYYFLLLFCMNYYKIRNTKLLLHIMGAISVFFLIVTSTFEKHHFYYTYYRLDKSGVFPQLEVGNTVLHTIYAVVISAYCIGAIVVTIIQIKRKTDRTVNLVNNICLLAVVIYPSACYIADKLMKPMFSLVPFGLLIADFCLLYLTGPGNICNINSWVREYIFESSDDVIIVVDKGLHYIEANQNAYDVFPELLNATVGDSIEHISGNVYRLFIRKEDEPEESKKIYHKFGEKTYELKIKLIKDRRVRGYILVLLDVTAQQENIRILENYQQDLEREVEEKTQALERIQENMITGLSELVEKKDVVTGSHIQRTSAYVDAIAKELMKEGKYADILTPSYCKKLKMVAPLHDIGKIVIPDAVLEKPGKYTPEEFEIMKRHCKAGEQIIEKILEMSDDKEYISIAIDVAKHHHEKWGGTGYPSKLEKDDIPLAARIMAVADVFDALVSKRPYKDAYDLKTSFSIIEEEAGVHFDPVIAQAFLNIQDKITKLYMDIGQD